MGRPKLTDEQARTSTMRRLTNYAIDENGCWIWQGYLDKNGYGRIYDGVARKMLWVHRVSFEYHVGPIPERYEIDHTCQVTACMNWQHLQAVTKVEHAAWTFRRLGKDDQHLFAARMRQVGMTYEEIAEALDLAGKASAFAAVQAAIDKGLVDASEVPRAKRLSDYEREEIRELYHLWSVPQGVLAEMYQIDNSQISRVCAGFTSGHTSQREAS